MTEQPTPNGPAAPRPVPDLGFFAPAGPARSQPAPPAQHAVPPDRFAPPPGQFAPPPGQFAPPPGQFAPPPTPFGAPPGTPFGTAPPAYAAYPAVQQRGGIPGWLIALIAVVVSFVILAVLAAVAIPVFLEQRAKATAAGTTVTFPETVEGLPRLRTPEAESVIQAQVSSVQADLLRDTQGAAYSDGRRHTVFVQVSRFTRVASPQDVDSMLAGFQHSAATDLPPGVTVSEWRDRAPGPLGGRISCATFEGNMTGQVCAAVESTTLLALVDLVPNASLDTDLPLMVRGAVIHRQH